MQTLQGSEPQVCVPGKSFPVTALGYPAVLLPADQTYERVTDKVGGIVLRHPRQKAWLAGFTVVFGLFSKVGDYRFALLYAGFLFLPAAAIAWFLPEPPDERSAVMPVE